jgi:hypothetical protein
MIAVVDAKTGHVLELRAAIEELAAAVRRERGCLTFVPYQDLPLPGDLALPDRGPEASSNSSQVTLTTTTLSCSSKMT